MKACLRRWKWVILYTAFLLSSLGLARRVQNWIYDRNLSGLIGWTLLLAGVACFVLIIRRMRRLQGKLSPFSLVRLVVFLLLYLVCVVKATSVTVERVHFIEYGLLAILCLQAVDERHPNLRRMIYAVTATFFIGFVDEVFQGFHPFRYYDHKDVILNVIAGVLPVAGMFWLPLMQTRPKQTRTIPVPESSGQEALPNLRPRISDACVLGLVLGVVCAMVWIGRVDGNRVLLPGRWERVNRCGLMEWMEIRKDGEITLEDAEGRRAVGWYEVKGDRLDGPQLRVEVILGSGEGPCDWETGSRIHAYFEVEKEQLVFKRRKAWSFRRVSPQEPIEKVQ